MLTRCPQCATVFRVSPQQLKVHHGEVRCGRCSTIFDAFDTMLEEAGAAAGVQSRATAPMPAPQDAGAEFDAAAGNGATAQDPAAAEVTAPAQPETAQLQPAFEAAIAAPEAPDYPWTREARRGWRWPWAVLALIAATALAGQAAVRYRAELVVLWPESRPLLERACAELRCKVTLPRHVELVGIDASDLQVDTAHVNLMLLTATIKNRAPFAQDYPLLSLTLTDTQDQALARRVLAPADYLERKAAAAAGFPANAELAVKLAVDSREVKATGYRLFLFYP